MNKTRKTIERKYDKIDRTDMLKCLEETENKIEKAILKKSELIYLTKNFTKNIADGCLLNCVTASPLIDEFLICFLNEVATNGIYGNYSSKNEFIDLCVEMKEAILFDSMALNSYKYYNKYLKNIISNDFNVEIQFNSRIKQKLIKLYNITDVDFTNIMNAITNYCNYSNDDEKIKYIQFIPLLMFIFLNQPRNYINNEEDIMQKSANSIFTCALDMILPFSYNDKSIKYAQELQLSFINNALCKKLCKVFSSRKKAKIKDIKYEYIKGSPITIGDDLNDSHSIVFTAANTTSLIGRSDNAAWLLQSIPHEYIKRFKILYQLKAFKLITENICIYVNKSPIFHNSIINIFAFNAISLLIDILISGQKNIFDIYCNFVDRVKFNDIIGFKLKRFFETRCKTSLINMLDDKDINILNQIIINAFSHTDLYINDKHFKEFTSNYYKDLFEPYIEPRVAEPHLTST